jgi:hypothetical protein
MAEKTNSQVNNTEIDPELEYLKQKSAKGAMNVVGDILDNPEIKKALMRKVTMPLIAVACLFIGILGLFDVAKQVLGLGWQVEAVISLVLATIGLSYLLKNMFTGKKHGD